MQMHKHATVFGGSRAVRLLLTLILAASCVDTALAQRSRSFGFDDEINHGERLLRHELRYDDSGDDCAFGRREDRGIFEWHDSQLGTFERRDWLRRHPDLRERMREHSDRHEGWPHRDYDRHDLDRNEELWLKGSPDYPDPWDRSRELNERERYAPLSSPQSEEAKSETEKIDDRLTARYSNPVNVRFARTLSAERGIQLFSEISRLIDQRHLKPTSYSSRVHRALKHLVIGINNRAFREAGEVSTSQFRADSLRHELSRLLSGSRVQNGQDAINAMRSTMTLAGRTVGLRPGVVACEFINASTDSLDRYSAFEPVDVPGVSGALDPALLKSVGPLDDYVVGIGVEVKQHDDGLLIVKTLAGGPASEAGLRKGDVIVRINGRKLAGRPMTYSVDLISGAAGTPVLLGVRRGKRSEASITLRRRRVRVLSVTEVRMLDRSAGVAYVKLDKFATSSSAELDQALTQLRGQGMKSLVVDVRGNPGGLLTSAIELSNKFVPCGTIVSTRGRQRSDNMHEQATFERTWRTPLVVLMDGNSASASEIFAAAIQENKRGVIVGMRSYGKGTVQTHFPLERGAGNLRLTTARFFSPTGRPMAESGVDPDLRVNDPDGEQNGDRVLERSVSVARHPKLAEMAAASSSCRIPRYGQTGNPEVSDRLSALNPAE